MHSGRSVIQHLEVEDGFSLWWMTRIAEKSPFKSPRIYDCIRLLALEELLREESPEAVELFTDDSDVAEAIGTLCRNLDIWFNRRRQWLRLPKAISKARLNRALPHPLQALIALARGVVVKWPLTKGGTPAWFEGANATFVCSYFIHLDAELCGNGRFASRQWEVFPEFLRRSGRRANWLQHFFVCAEVPDAATGLGWLRQFNDRAETEGRHAFIAAYLSPSVLALALLQWLRLFRVHWSLRDVAQHFHTAGSKASLWPLLREDWQTSLIGSAALDNCLWFHLFQRALSGMPHQPLGFFLYENQGWERAMIHAWRKNGHGRIIGVQHATAPFWFLSYFEDERTLSETDGPAAARPDRIAVNGDASKTALLSNGFRPEDLVEVEALRYLGLPSVEHRAANSPFVCRVLIVGDLVGSVMDGFLRMLEAVAKQLPPSFRFTFKPHPAYVVDIARYPSLAAGVTTAALSSILQDFDVVVAANSTSAAVDAYQAGLRVIVALDPRALNLSPLLGRSDVAFVSNQRELLTALTEEQPATGHAPDNYFFLDPDLPRWKQLLENLNEAS